MDYDSGGEEEDVDEGCDDGEDAEEQGEAVEEESQPDSTGGRVQRNMRQPKRGGAQCLDQMRVNSVLQLSSAIERYDYDVEHELWCEVR